MGVPEPIQLTPPWNGVTDVDSHPERASAGNCLTEFAAMKTSAPMAAVPQSPERGDQRWMAVLDGHTLRQLRRKNGLSQEQLAAKAGLSPDTVARLERKSQSRCRSRTLVRLAAAVGEAPGALAAETAGVIPAFEAAELVFSPDGGFRYGGGRDLSRLEEQARASDHDIRETAVDT